MSGTADHDGRYTHIDYTIPLEDIEVTPEEVAGSRRHQFFAFCRDSSTQEYLPEWINEADVDTATMMGLGPTSPDPENVLETSAEWASCFHGISPDDDRYPIECASVDRGVTWDITNVPTGVYSIAGYTFEPQFNVWHRRLGAVKITDSSVGDDPPAAAVFSTQEYAFRNEDVYVPVCVDAPPGSTFSMSWTALGPDGTEFEPVLEDHPVECGRMDVLFDPPDSASGETIIFRVDVTAPDGRTYAAHSRSLTILLPFDYDSCGDTGSFVPPPDPGAPPPEYEPKELIDHCDVVDGSGHLPFDAECLVGDPEEPEPWPVECPPEEDTDDGGTEGTSTSAGGSDDSNEGTDGCLCSGGEPPNRWSAIVLVLVGLTRRRHRAPHPHRG